MKRIILALFLTCLITTGYGYHLLSVGGGVIDPSEPRAVYQADYKFSNLKKYLRPQVGALTEEFESLFVYAGMGFEIIILDWFVLTPSFSPGLYFQGSSGRDLGHVIEFRSCFEAAIAFRNCWRVGGQFYHISNASISSRNPGVNAAVGFLSIPF